MKSSSAASASAGRGGFRRSRLLLEIAILGFICWVGFDGFYWEPNHPKAEIHRLPTRKWAKGGKPIRLVQISDLHLKKFGSREKRVVKIIRELQPDLIVMTGDYLEDPLSISCLKTFLNSLPNSAVKIATLGNIDHQIGVTEEEWRGIFSEFEVKLLVNSRLNLEFDSRPICIIGLDDPSTGKYQFSAIKHLSPTDFNLLLAHSPELYQLLQGKRIDLCLAGHTHGGQIRIPGIPSFWMPQFNRKYRAGFYQKGGLLMYTNRGIGTTIYPVRFLCRPEIALFEVTGSGLKGVLPKAREVDY